MVDKLISLETAKLAKEKGFDELCAHTYADDNFVTNYKWLSAPTQSLLQKWLREKYYIHIYVVPYGDTVSWILANIGYTNRKTDEYRLISLIKDKYDKIKFKSYEEAVEIALQEALKLIP